ncbi:MAG: hypothetical protein IPG96_07035 [Proteobacteria bacterium]|nr:hypothetical protein [Pseudomonadota bacterium]
MNLRLLAREASLLLFGTLAAYLVHATLAGRLLGWAARRGVEQLSPWLQLALGALALDGSKLLGLLPVAWVVGPLLVARPWVAATLLVLACFALELAVNAVLQQVGGLWTPWPLALIRVADAAALVWPLGVLLRQRRARAPGQGLL